VKKRNIEFSTGEPSVSNLNVQYRSAGNSIDYLLFIPSKGAGFRLWRIFEFDIDYWVMDPRYLNSFSASRYNYNGHRKSTYVNG